MEQILDAGMTVIDQHDAEMKQGNAKFINNLPNGGGGRIHANLFLETADSKRPYQFDGYIH